MSKTTDKVFQEVYQEIVNRITSRISSASEVPWFSAGELGYFPSNPITGTQYSGWNMFFLMKSFQYHSYKQNLWFTGKNIFKNGGKIKNNTYDSIVYYAEMYTDGKGKWLTYPKYSKLSSADKKEFHKVLAPKGYAVYNIENTEGLEHLYRDIPRTQFEVKDFISRIIENSEAELEHKRVTEAYYVPSQHRIVLPVEESFKSEEQYYRILLHEFAHWTSKDLNRVVSTKKDSKEYWQEELIAELTSVFVLAHYGIEKTLPNSASYLNGYLNALEDGVKPLKSIMSKATRAAKLLIKFSEEKEQLKAA